MSTTECKSAPVPSWRRNRIERRKLIKSYLAQRDKESSVEDIATIGKWLVEAAKTMISRNCKKRRKGKPTYETLWDEDLRHYIGSAPTLKVRRFTDWIKVLSSEEKWNSKLEAYLDKEVLDSNNYNYDYAYEILEKIRHAIGYCNNTDFQSIYR